MAASVCRRRSCHRSRQRGIFGLTAEMMRLPVLPRPVAGRRGPFRGCSKGSVLLVSKRGFEASVFLGDFPKQVFVRLGFPLNVPKRVTLQNDHAFGDVQFWLCLAKEQKEAGGKVQIS